MTELEAIEELKYDCGQLGKSIPSDTNWAQSMNTAYGMAIAALEKQVPKKRVNYDNCGNRCLVLRCPSCFEVQDREYCDNCGQRLDLVE